MKLTLHDPPEGFLAEAEYRPVMKGETYLNGAGRPVSATADTDLWQLIILTPDPALQRPDWLPERMNQGWIAKDESGGWYWFEANPQIEEGAYWTLRGSDNACEMPPILIPPDHDPAWRDSLICCEVKS